MLKVDVLFNSTHCYYKLAITMAHFITNRGGTNKFVVESIILGDYLKLKIYVDISLLDNTIRYLSTDALDFFKLWYTQPYVIDGLIYHPSSYVGYDEK